MARQRGTLEKQARQQAAGASSNDKPSRGVTGGGVFDKAVVDHVRVRAYYPPTRKFYDATEEILELSWSDAVDQAAVQLDITIDNPDGTAAETYNRAGMIWFIETRADGNQFRERLRATAWTTEVDEPEAGSSVVTVTAFDALMFLQIAKGHSFAYKKDKKHKKGWRAHEIALDIIQKYKIPVAHTAPVTRKKGGKTAAGKKTKGGKAETTGNVRVVKTKYTIPYLNMRNVSLYEALAKPYTVDRKHTKRHYYLEAIKGKVAIVRKPAATRVLAITPSSLRAYSFTRDLSDSFASVVIPLGADKTGDKKKKRAKGDKSKSKAKDPKRDQKPKAKRSKAEKEGKGQIEVKADQQAALTMLFGNVVVGKRLNNIRDRNWTHAEAQRVVNALSRTVKSLSLTCDGNVFVKQGDRVFVRIPIGPKFVMRKDLYVSSVSHSMVPGDYTMTLELKWREREVDVNVPASSEELNKATPKGGGTPAKGNGAIRGHYNAEQAAQLCEENGWPSGPAHTMGAIVMGESGGDPNIQNSIGATGLFQILLSAHPDVSEQCAKDPECAARAALKIYNEAGGFSPWEAYTNGSYKQFLF